MLNLKVKRKNLRAWKIMRENDNDCRMSEYLHPCLPFRCKSMRNQMRHNFEKEVYINEI